MFRARELCILTLRTNIEVEVSCIPSLESPVLDSRFLGNDGYIKAPYIGNNDRK